MMTSKIKEIAEGWYYDAFKDNIIEELSKFRMMICKTCNFNVNNKCSKKKCETINNKEICGCGCPLRKATRSPNKQCPKGLW